MQELNGITIGRYLVEKQLAKGGMSQIYLACDTSTGCQVAIKFVHASHNDHCARFHREVNAMATLQHKHILPVLDHGEYGPWCYMITPYIAKGTLHERISQGALSLTEAGVILEQLAAALQFAHDSGIVHRDIKPSNILLLNEQHVYLADFGLVKSIRDEHSITEPGYLIGTPEYMAPELAEEDATARSDIYALGVLLYQMVTGRVPFRGRTPLSSFLKQLSELPEPPSTVNPLIPLSIDIVILHALEKKPHRRFQTALDLSRAYQQALSEPERLPVGALAIDAPSVRIIPRQSPAKIKVPMSAWAATLIMSVLFMTCLLLLSSVSVTPEGHSPSVSVSTMTAVVPVPTVKVPANHSLVSAPTAEVPANHSLAPAPTAEVPNDYCTTNTRLHCSQHVQTWTDNTPVEPDQNYHYSDQNDQQNEWSSRRGYRDGGQQDDGGTGGCENGGH
ncbi:MAG: serine/threonine protein kinase [Chloroflexi bacterium]|nr:MAG: serine/threonine protein kinase [Chloroflexota bacterium]